MDRKKLCAFLMTLLTIAFFVVGYFLSFINKQSYYQLIYQNIVEFIDIVKNGNVNDNLSQLIGLIVIIFVPFLMFFVFIRAFVCIFVRNVECKIILKEILMFIVFIAILFMAKFYGLINFPDSYLQFIANNQFLNKLVTTSTNIQIELGFYIEFAIIILIFIINIIRKHLLKVYPDERKSEEIQMNRFKEASSTAFSKNLEKARKERENESYN